MGKRFLCLLFAVTLILSSCNGAEKEAETETGKSETETGAIQTGPETAKADGHDTADVVYLSSDGATDFKIVYNTGLASNADNFERIRTAFERKFGTKLRVLSDEKQEEAYEIIVNSGRRTLSRSMKEQLSAGEYGIRVESTDGGCKVVLVYSGQMAMTAVVDRFIDECIIEKGGVLPADLDLKGKCDPSGGVIKSGIGKLRDPFVLLDDDGTYYMFGSGWACFRNTSGKLNGKWTEIQNSVKHPDDYGGDPWAPEVHKYNGMYYMFTTYYSKKNSHRGSTILRSKRPYGPYIEITDGVLTPPDWSCIDATLYVDDDGQPWIIFVREFLTTPDDNGRMYAAKLSDDLTKLVSEPVELFRAKDPKWAKNNVTDGPFIYKNTRGELLMLWSNWDTGGYCVGVARSASGRVDGKWTHDPLPLYSRILSGEYDGGHGMIFADKNGQMYLAIHSPNNGKEGTETPIFVPVKETDGNLVWDLWEK